MNEEKNFWTEERINHAKMVYAALMYGHARLGLNGDILTVDMEKRALATSVMLTIGEYIKQDQKDFKKGAGKNERDSDGHRP